MKRRKGRNKIIETTDFTDYTDLINILMFKTKIAMRNISIRSKTCLSFA